MAAGQPANKGFKHVGRLELPVAGQVVVEGHYAYIGHMRPPHGTTIVDIADPTHPRVVSQLVIAPNLHSHKVRVHGDVMLVNHPGERLGVPPSLGRPESAGWLCRLGRRSLTMADSRSVSERLARWMGQRSLLFVQ